ncbi:MAG: two-component sensor histidine kinase [Ignavibacteria bacterium]|nr:two-component sensor histidine kinase [Ignavibacteria bacterium]MBP6509428.1 two-component sensor histidine kinase [Candidatus Kapabacteria bacterium]MBK6759263.1 two-component sensor histidine kinase [Ignavibacteria bacterium]MBK7184990.1 two-component sensor histidine kinase [Ignavibacteria bacterium]MBK7412956.1 two-component sensor histidine kinase [Ignavibacteria bacterium]
MFWLTLSLVGVNLAALVVLAITGTDVSGIGAPRILLFILLVSGGGAACVWIFLRSQRTRIVEPLDRIIEITHAITDGAVSGRIELGKNALLDVVRVADAINRLAHKAAKDIDEMRRLERVRSEFVANVSHELRTPIFSVQGYLETLLDGAMDDPQVSLQFLEKAYNNALRLNALLSDLIDISRIESGELKFSFRYFDIGELLRDIVHTTEIRAAQRNVTVHCDIAENSTVYGDKERLTQVMTNLLENAIKYNVDGGDVYVSTKHVDTTLRISVRDTGIGIPEESLPRIFERFYRVDKDRSRAVGGTGLGLAIVKHILEAHHAPIAVDSGVGRGTEISFVLEN